MKKKILDVVLTLAMVISFMPTMAFAEGEGNLPARNQSGYILLENDNATYKLTSNVTDLVVVTGKNVTIDLNGNNIAVEWSDADSAGVYMAVQVAGGSLTLKNSSNSVGTVSSTLKSGTNKESQAAGVMVCNDGSFTLDSGKITANANSDRETFGVLVFSAKSGGAKNSFTMNGGEVKAEYGVRVMYEGASFTMRGGTVEGDFAVSGHGDAKGDTSIDISDGTITGNYQGIYHPQTGTMNITGGTISGWGGVEVKGGIVTIDGATITATGKKGQYSDNNMGSSSVGYAVAVVEDNDYKGGTVTIDSGSFTGGVAILKSGKEEVYNSATLNIKSGVFSDGDLYKNLTGDVCKSATTESGEYTVAQAHKYDTTKTVLTEKPTCTETGVEKVFCTVCGKEGEEYTREVSALGHDYSIWVSDGTQHWQKCSRCDATTEKENHVAGDTCTTCGHGCSHNADKIKSYSEKQATCAEEGYKAYSVCESCGKHVVASGEGESITYTVTSDSLVTIPKLDHEYSFKYDSSQHWQVCSVCGDTTAKLDHEYSGRTCTVCGYTKPKSSSGGSSSSGTTTDSDKTTNNDGSTTTTETKSDGTKVETTTSKDGSTTKVETKTETKSDGTKVETKKTQTTESDGTKSEATTKQKPKLTVHQ